MTLQRAWIVKAMAATMMLVPAVAAKAAIVSTKDSSLFNFKYEMDVSPDADNQGGGAGPDWAFSGAASTSVGGGIFTMTTSGVFEVVNTDTAAGLSFATGYTMEIRARVLDEGAFERAITVFGGPSPAGSAPAWMTLGKSQVRFNDSGSNSSGTQLSTASNSDSFHIFRVAQEPGGGAYSVWRDGILLSETLLGNVGNASGTVKVDFGDFGGDWGGTTEIDYFRFDTSGAYAPVPEPTVCVLLVSACGVFALRKVQRLKNRRLPV